MKLANDVRVLLPVTIPFLALSPTPSDRVLLREAPRRAWRVPRTARRFTRAVNAESQRRWAAHVYRDHTAGRPLPAAVLGGTTVESKIANYVPGSIPANVWEVIAEPVRDWVSKTNHATPLDARRALTATAQFARYCWQEAGLGLDPEDLFHLDLINEFVINALPDVSITTRSTYRSDLLKIARAVRPTDLALRGNTLIPAHEGVNPPYTPAEERLLWSWAEAQATQPAVINAKVMLAAGLGAGLFVNELMNLTARDVHVDDDGVLLTIGGDRPRIVPVRIEWEDTLATLAQAALRRDMYLFRPGRRSITPNSVYNFVSRSKNRPFPISMQRLRTTWIINHLAAGVPVPVVRNAAGIHSRTGMRRYLDFLAEPDPDTVRQSLRHGRLTPGTER